MYEAYTAKCLHAHLMTRLIAHVRKPGLYPKPKVVQRPQSMFSLPQINNGVYKSGFSTTQAAYDRAQRELYSALETVEQRLSQHRFLVGDK